MTTAYGDGLQFAYLAATEFKLDPYEARVLAVVMNHWNVVKQQAWPSVERICKTTGIGHAKVSRCLKSIVDHRLLVVKDRGPRTNLYVSPAFEQWLRLGRPEDLSSLTEMTSSTMLSPTEITVISQGDHLSSPTETLNSEKRTLTKNSDPDPSDQSPAGPGTVRTYRVNEGIARYLQDKVDVMTGSTAGVNIAAVATELAKWKGDRRDYLRAVDHFLALYPDKAKGGFAGKAFMAHLPVMLKHVREAPDQVGRKGRPIYSLEERRRIVESYNTPEAKET